jgi:hypothetical protein
MRPNHTRDVSLVATTPTNALHPHGFFIAAQITHPSIITLFIALKLMRSLWREACASAICRPSTFCESQNALLLFVGHDAAEIERARALL